MDHDSDRERRSWHGDSCDDHKSDRLDREPRSHHGDAPRDRYSAYLAKSEDRNCHGSHSKGDRHRDEGTEADHHGNTSERTSQKSKTELLLAKWAADYFTDKEEEVSALGKQSCKWSEGLTTLLIR